MKFFLIAWNIIWALSIKEMKISKAKKLNKIVMTRKRGRKRNLIKRIQNQNLNLNQKERRQKVKKR
jgi:hypothetical protein